MYQTKTFKSKDGLLITGDLYKVKDAKGLMLLCHRSHCNRAEYREAAARFLGSLESDVGPDKNK
ncbi:MAG: hypothetical protein CVV45_01230 [Spirochaetae bacterium HGW-Spirochaetae-10]|nr:MAG: hypothetical protein CVV45_01230 [Spirochaetae bacterium HGW-Spirochaetae-10]